MVDNDPRRGARLSADSQDFELPPARRGREAYRGEGEGTGMRVLSGRWEAFGRGVLGFHGRVWRTGMCFCGRTVIECDVLALARQYGLVDE